MHDGEKVVRDLKVEFASVGDGKYQPTVTVNDIETGVSSITKLPVSDYTALGEKLNRTIANLDPQSVPRFAGKIGMLLSFLR